MTAEAALASIVLATTAVAAGSCPADDGKLHFVVIDPGHFHAALVQKHPYGDDVSTDVRVYAPRGPELDAHLALIRSFNERAENPTRWNEIVYSGDDYLERAVEENRGARNVVVVLAGRNDRKAGYCLAAVRAGFHVMADKPLAITPETYGTLSEAMRIAREKNLVVMDLMTDRHEFLNSLQSELAHDAALFGEQVAGSPENPGIVRESVHHFFKLVNGAPLKRPAWYYDTSCQGAAIVDVTTHIVDDVRWTALRDARLSQDDVEVVSARRWPTPVTLADFKASTGCGEWTEGLRRALDADGVLQCDANGEFTYRQRGVFAKVRVEWRFRAQPGGGDASYALMRGTKAEVGIRTGAADGAVLFVRPAPGADAAKVGAALDAALKRLSGRWPGLAFEPESVGWRVVAPKKLFVSHEEQFREVAKTILGWVRGGQPQGERDNLLVKYRTLVDAYRISGKK